MVQYDANGNVLNDSLHVYTWDAEGRPLTVDGVGLTYDALGRMVEQNRSGAYTQIVYSPSGGKLALMSAQTLQKALVPLSGRAMAVYNSSGLLYYAHADMLGSIRLGTTPAGAMYFDVAYAPFGETYAQLGSVDPAYTGKMADTSQRQDTSGGLYDFPLREYSVQGRWPSPDPAGLVSVCFMDPQTQNRYAYVRNNPMSFVDPLGAQPCDPFFDPFCGFCPFFDPFCGEGRRCSPFDPFCHPLLLLPIVRIGRGGGGGERPRRLNLALIPPLIFRALEGGDAQSSPSLNKWEQCRRDVFVPCIDEAERKVTLCGLVQGGWCVGLLAACGPLCDVVPFLCGQCITTAVAKCAAGAEKCRRELQRRTGDCLTKQIGCVYKTP